MLPLEFCNWDIQPWVVPMDSVEVAFEATVVSKPTIALSTWNHGCSGELCDSRWYL